MNPDLKHRELTEQIIGVFYDVYNELGHGYLESIYATALAISPSGRPVCRSSRSCRSVFIFVER